MVEKLTSGQTNLQNAIREANKLDVQQAIADVGYGRISENLWADINDLSVKSGDRIDAHRALVALYPHEADYKAPPHSWTEPVLSTAQSKAVYAAMKEVHEAIDARFKEQSPAERQAEVDKDYGTRESWTTKLGESIDKAKSLGIPKALDEHKDLIDTRKGLKGDLFSRIGDKQVTQLDASEAYSAFRAFQKCAEDPSLRPKGSELSTEEYKMLASAMYEVYGACNQLEQFQRKDIGDEGSKALEKNDLTPEAFEARYKRTPPKPSNNAGDASSYPTWIRLLMHMSGEQ